MIPFSTLSSFIPLFALGDLGWEFFAIYFSPLIFSVVFCLAAQILGYWNKRAAQVTSALALVSLSIQVCVLLKLFMFR
jgi:hypothetical protein